DCLWRFHFWLCIGRPRLGGATVATTIVSTRLRVDPTSGFLSAGERLLSSAYDSSSGRRHRRAPSRSAGLVSVLLVSGPFSAIEWSAGPSSSGSAGVDWLGGHHLRHSDSVRIELFPDTSQ